MRKLSLLIVLLVFVMTVNAQSFTISPSNSISATIDTDGYRDMTIDMDNISGTDLVLEWELVSNSFPQDWGVTLCDYQQCFANIPASRVMEPVPANGKGYIKLSILPYQTVGTGVMEFDVWDTTDKQGTLQRISFDVNTVLGLDDNDLSNNVSVYPNPAQDFVILKAQNGSLDAGTVTLTDMTGALVRQQEVRAVATAELSLNNLPAGMYIMLYETKSGMMTEKVFKTN